MTDFTESKGAEGKRGGTMSDYRLNPKWFSLGLVFVGLVGACLSGLSFREHLRSKFQAGYSSFCNLGGSFNCGEVIASKYASIFGIPTALFGLAFYLAILFLGLAALRRSTRGVQVEALLISCISAGASIVLSAISFLILKAVCILCIGIYTVSTIFLGLSLGATLKAKKLCWAEIVKGLRAILSFPYKVIFPDSESNKLTNNIALLGVIVTFSLFLWLNLVWTKAKVAGSAELQSSEASGTAGVIGSAALEAWQRSLPRIISETKGEDLAWGPENAPVTVVEFTDFECPACRAVFPQLDEAISEFRNDIRVVFKQYPLSSRCNPNLKHDGHKHACFSAQAALCMNRLVEGASEKIAHGLFNLPSLEDESSSEEVVKDEILKLGSSLGIDRAQLLNCISSSEISGIILRNIKEGDSLKIKGTPSIFIAGKEVLVRRSGQFKAVLRKALESAQAQ